MGIIALLAILTDIAILVVYYANPLIQHHLDLISEDLYSAFDLHQSLCLVGVCAIARAFGFGYMLHSTRYFPSTRCIVFMSTLAEVGIFAVAFIQAIIWQQYNSSFSHYRVSEWHRSLFWSVIILTIISTSLQIICTLKLNGQNSSLEDEEVLEKMLMSSSTDNQEIQRNLWRLKWRALTKHFSKQSELTFDNILRLYAHKQGAVENLGDIYKHNPLEFEFYIPQLCSFLFLGAFLQSPKLCIVLLEKCERSHIFAHKMYLFLQSFCLSSVAYASAERHKQVKVLIEEVACRGEVPARKFQNLDSESPVSFENTDRNADEASPLVLKSSKCGTNQDRNFQQEMKSKAKPFQENLLFIDSLSRISSHLRNVNIRDRNTKLREMLINVSEQFLPSNSLYLPVGKSLHRIKHIQIDESFTFSTRERVPYLLCVEVVDSDLRDKDAGRLFRMKIGSHEFRIPIFDKASDINAKLRSSQNSNGKALSPRTPDAAKLGFWSENKAVCVSQGLDSNATNSSGSFLIQPASSLINGLLDTLSVKRSRADESLRSTIGDFRSSVHSTSQSSSPHSPYHKRPRFSLDSEAEISKVVDEAVSLLESGQARESEKRSFKQNSPSDNYHISTLKRVDSTDIYLESLCDLDSMNEIEGTTPYLSKRENSTPCVVFPERWRDKEDRIKEFSPWGHLKGWRLLPVIVKSNDDLRQEQFASQLITQFSKVFREHKLPVWMRPYDVIATSSTAGLVEAIPDTISLDALKRYDTAYNGLLDFFIRRFGEPSSSAFRKARQNFVKSMAAYSIVCYLLQIKDRHNGNILLDADGHVIHIDFGFILSNNPGNMHFEQAPFKLTDEFVELMGGQRSATFRDFRSLCVRTYLVARKYRHRITLLVEMMINGNEHLPCFAGDPRGTINRLTARFKPDLDTNECEMYVHELIDRSLNSWRTRWYDKYQRWCVGIF